MVEKVKVLDIGYGKTRYTGIYKSNEDITYLDKEKLPHVDILCDINKNKIPLKDNQFDLIYIRDVLHHVDNIIEALEECHRILKKGGKIIINVPHYTSFNAYRDMLAKHFMTRFSMDYFKKDNKLNFYTKARFNVKCILKPSGYGKILPRFIRNRLCFILNGLIDEIIFELEK
jgi:SAM-dependent methyltransferase